MIDYANNYPLVQKQFDALKVIANEKNGCAPMSLDDVIASLSYETTKASFQFTLRSLIKRGLVEKLPRQNIGGKSRRLLQVTPLGLHKIKTEYMRDVKSADYRTCMIDEIAKTDRMIAELEKMNIW